jgi:hypothetical protein
VKIDFMVRDPDPQQLEGLEVLVCPVSSDARPLRGLAGAVDWTLGGKLSRALQEERFEGRRGDRLLVVVEGRLPIRYVLLLGIGRRDAFGAGQLVPLFRAMARVLDAGDAQHIGLSLEEHRPGGCSRHDVATALVAGLVAGSKRPQLQLCLLDGHEHAAEVALDMGRVEDRFDDVALRALE